MDTQISTPWHTISFYCIDFTFFPTNEAYKRRISDDYNFYSWTSIDGLTLRKIEF